VKQVVPVRLGRLEQWTLQNIQDRQTPRSQGLHVMDRLVSDDASNCLVACILNFNFKVVRYSLTYLSVWKLLVGDVPFYVKIWQILTHLLAKRRNLFSLVAPQPSQLAKKSSINTTRKSIMRFPMNLKWIVYVDPKGDLKRKVSKI